jgi:flagellar hook-associated protein 1 FlgK
MPGLFGTLNLGSRALQTHRAGVEVAGQNLANVNNPAYARQRVAITTSIAIDGGMGPQGTGSQAVAVVQLRNALVDRQIVSEGSVRGSLEAQQRGLQFAEAGIGELLEGMTGGASGSVDGVNSAGNHGISSGLASLFNAFQTVAGDPRSLATRQVLISKASDLAGRFQEVDRRLDTVVTALDESIQADVRSANSLMDEVSKLNQQIGQVESLGEGRANDLRDLRQQKLEELSGIVRVETTTDADGTMSLSVDGTTMVSGSEVVERMEAYTDVDGRTRVKAAGTGAPLTTTGGSIQGSIDVRDGAIAALRTEINQLAEVLIEKVNDIHRTGFGLEGTTGQDFFEGTSAADIQVNQDLLRNPAKLQASQAANEVGDNSIVLELAQLGHESIAELDGQTFVEHHSQTVVALGEAMRSVDTGLSDQDVVSTFLTKQRDAVSGVSLDEEMTDLTRFQKAFSASARLITVIDGMLEDVIAMKR